MKKHIQNPAEIKYGFFARCDYVIAFLKISYDHSNISDLLFETHHVKSCAIAIQIQLFFINFLFFHQVIALQKL